MDPANVSLPPAAVRREVPYKPELGLFLSHCVQFCRMSTGTEEVKPGGGKPESEKKKFYCEVSAFLDGFSDFVLKCRLEVLNPCSRAAGLTEGGVVNL